jgi:Protein of unknown function (DUF2442)
MLEVSSAKYIDGYRIELLFNDGERRIVDLKNSLDGPVFQPLKDLNFFKKFKINFNTIEWPNGADFAPEYLYEIAVADNLKVAEPETVYKKLKKK